LADFLDARFSEEIARQSSLTHAIAKDLRKVTEEQMQAVEKKAQELERSSAASSQADAGVMRHELAKLQLLVAQDQKNAESETNRLHSLAVGCVTELSNCLAESTGQLTKVACRLLSLWFQCKSEYPEVTNVVRKAIPRLALGHLNPFIYQLASRLDVQDGPFQDWRAQT
jgi:hypothetical protein